ncbi:FkbM family methyltransferase [Tautonia sp. JC769]|uniref:FkbM family methyltransferase n=1 Tax=Tautonia sp. JC769 TaxID=3232135 RepID=UPI00345A9B22
MLPRMVSYAGNFEDVLLRRAFAGQPAGFFIDVGAYDPVDGSVTKHFSQLGWRGINIEPDPAPFARLVADRPNDINLNLALSDSEGTLRLYTAEGAAHPSVDRNLITGWFGARPEDVREIELPATTLAAVCEAHVPPGQAIDFLKVDVESHEYEVLLGNDWDRWRPRVLIVESSAPERWEPALSAARYHFTLFDGINRVYVRGEDAHLIPLLSVPVNQTDNFDIFGYAHQIADLTHRLDTYRQIGPRALHVARWLHDRAERHPRLASIARQWLGRAAG